ncbi:MAG: hypothetical protein U0667_06520 [Chloroflexota bacterium]
MTTTSREGIPLGANGITYTAPGRKKKLTAEDHADPQQQRALQPVRLAVEGTPACPDAGRRRHGRDLQGANTRSMGWLTTSPRSTSTGTTNRATWRLEPMATAIEKSRRSFIASCTGHQVLREVADGRNRGMTPTKKGGAKD